MTMNRWNINKVEGKPAISFVAAAAKAVAWRYGGETLMPKYIRLQPRNALTTSAPFVRSATTSSAPVSSLNV